MKLGHYMKIPPRITFAGMFAVSNPQEQDVADHSSTVQVVAATVACLISFAVKRMLFFIVDDICSPTQADQFSK
jgi:hypothetical protein